MSSRRSSCWWMVCTALSSIVAMAEYQPRLVGEEARRTREEIEAMIDEDVVLINPDVPLRVRAQDARGAPYMKPVFTGRGFLNEMANGYDPRWRERYERNLAVQFTRRIFPLLLVMEAKPCATSYVADLRCDEVSLQDIPVSINWHRESSADDSQSFLEDCPESVVTLAEPWKMKWQCIRRDGGAEPYIWEYHLDLLAWGDFNGDGYEDVCCDFAMNYLTGSNSDYYQVILTRRQPRGRLELVDHEWSRVHAILSSGAFQP